jgi:diguanylate cyclase (GGDEF)-like protein
MSRPLTALVLTPSLGWDFFADVLAGVTREIVGAGGRLLVVETLQESAVRDEAGEQGDFATAVGWAQVDGVISLTTAVDEDYLKQLDDAGKPVVLLSSTRMEDFEAPSARPDNYLGAVAATEHLIAHGHTRIGFVGNLVQRDIRDRFEAYQKTLEAHGIPVDPKHLFEAPENGETGGAVASRGIIDSPHRPTALVVATDRNAIGVVAALKGAGIEVPRDIAIVAFDNIPAGTFSTPTLSTIDARFDEVGALASRLLIAAIGGEPPANETFMPGSAALVVRDSCGCGPDSSRPGLAPSDKVAGAGAPLLRERLHDVLERPMRTGAASVDNRTREAVQATVEEAVRLVELGDAVTSQQVEGLSASLRTLTSRADTLRRFTDALVDYAHSFAPAAEQPEGASTRFPALLAASLWKAQAGAAVLQVESTATAIAEQYVVDAGLLNTGGSDPRDLLWLTGTSVKAGALALWDGGPESGQVRIVGEYDAYGRELDLIDATMSGTSFPPEALISRVSAAERDICVVVPVSTHDQDWGLLALVADLESTTARETFQHWAALLCAALESQHRQEELRRTALFDALTGLPNRQLFVQQLEQAIARWKRDATPFSVLFLDLDGFKLINDSLGHQMGDRVLKTVGAEIARQLRGVDTAARFGGDEFVILLADTEPGRAMVAAQRVQAALAQVRNFDGHEIETRASVGIASSAVGYESAEEVLRDADAAMYRAKAAEPGTVAYFDAPMHDSARRRAALAREVLKALQEKQFEVHYQPIVNLATGRTDRFESLVRWNHPEHGLIEPDEFLTDIEETSLIVQLGHWVLNEVCRQLAQWGTSVANVSINVSDKEFWSQDLLSHVLATLHRHHLTPDVLTLEITESVLMRRPEMALRIMHKLHEAGLRLHIDDFGTGYSSLETLHRFPVEAFKIDRSFIQSLSGEDNSAELISSLVKLGKALGLSVLAEGVETEEQRSFLEDLGCVTGQGYLFMPAVTGDKVAELLGRSLNDHGDA